MGVFACVGVCYGCSDCVVCYCGCIVSWCWIAMCVCVCVGVVCVCGVLL